MDIDTDRNIQTQQVCSVQERKGSQSSGACWHNKPTTDIKTKTVHERVPPQAQHPEAVHQGWAIILPEGPHWVFDFNEWAGQN